MILSFDIVARGALSRWRRDRDVLLALAGVFLFLPTLAWLLLIPPPAAPASATTDQATALLVAWAGQNAQWLALRIVTEVFASAALLTLYLARGHRDVGGMLKRTLVIFPLFAAAVIASWGLVAVGCLAFLVPGFYVFGRVALTGPVLIAEPGIGVVGAITRSVALTHGRGWLVFGLLGSTLLAGVVAVEVLTGLGSALVKLGLPDPIALVLVGIAAAAVASASVVVRMLFEVEIYRRLAAPRHGI